MKISIIAAVLSLGLAAAVQAQEAGAAPEREFGGPSVLSRSPGTNVQHPLESVRFRPFLNLTGLYESGLLAPSVNSAGELTSRDSAGMEASFGVYGYQARRHTVIGVDYRGSYRHNTVNSYFDGTDQNLALGISHQLSKRFTVNLREAAGIMNRAFGNSYAFWIIDPSFANVPQNQLFNNRVMYTSTTTDLTYQKSARWSFNMGGDQMVTRFRSSAFYGFTMTRARGDSVYRYSKRGSIGVVYSFDHVGYTKNFGASDDHSVGLVHSLQLSRQWEWRMQLAGIRVETLGAARVELDPAIAAIIGQTQGVQAVYRVNYLPNIRVTLNWSGRRSGFDVGGNMGTSPGNGVYLMSKEQSLNLNARFSATRRLGLNASANYMKFRSLTISMGDYANINAGGGVSYKISGMLHLTANVSGMHYNISSMVATRSDYRRNSYRASVGFSLAPGDLPLSIW